ncbi:hypothetical protein OF829_03420 [Sphingomonas sp. LB-2]|uniref:hypothetical protein n=1 Tax=Sphingomonas caeni TaxID=2984949 RepID=UPI002232506D|nr:hypothetical protein [Sphingomonas caeni]MCW3846275.1 hypothetical protein [Sphingomonas caeni]
MRLVYSLLPLLVLATPALAQERSKRLDAVVECRKLTDSAERLACYDKAVADLDSAEKSREVVVVDKEQVREARRGLFGLSLPRIRLFDSSDEPDLDEVTSTVKSISTQGDGRVFFVLEDGARWVQTDNRTVVNVRPGTQVTLKRAAMGSFFAKFHGSISVRVKRVN